MSRAHYTPYTGPGPKRVYYVKHVGPGENLHQIVYNQPISVDQISGKATTSTVIYVPGTYPTLESAAMEAARLNLGLEYCQKCERLFDPSALDNGRCCSCQTADKQASSKPAKGKRG